MADEKNIAAEDEDGGGGGKKKLIIIIAAVVLLLALGGGAAFFFLGGDDTPADAEGGEEAEAVELGEPVYHKLEPAFVVNLTPGGQAKMLQVAIEVMTRAPSVVETLSKNDPMIRHHVLLLLEEQTSDALMDAAGREKLQQSIHDMLAAKLKELNEPGELHGVYFTQFVMQ